MSHKNYSGFSRKKEEPQNHQISIDEITNETPVETVENTEETKTVFGVVDGCDSLNVRKESNKESDVLCIINKSTKIVIDLENSTEDFYKVSTSQGIDGYCMKKFISISSEF